MEEHGRHLKSLEVRRAAGGARDSSGAQPKSSLGTAAAVTHDRTVARRFHRTHKEGYRGSNYLWSGCFFNLVGSFVAPNGSTGSFHNTVEGITALLEFRQQQQWSWWRWKPRVDTRKKQCRCC